jgi:hypothetical protein
MKKSSKKKIMGYFVRRPPSRLLKGVIMRFDDRKSAERECKDINSIAVSLEGKDTPKARIRAAMRNKDSKDIA